MAFLLIPKIQILWLFKKMPWIEISIIWDICMMFTISMQLGHMKTFVYPVSPLSEILCYRTVCVNFYPYFFVSFLYSSYIINQSLVTLKTAWDNRMSLKEFGASPTVHVLIHWIIPFQVDMTSIYGSTLDDEHLLRSHKDGKLQMQVG